MMAYRSLTSGGFMIGFWNACALERGCTKQTWCRMVLEDQITGSVATFTNLTAGTDYRFRFYEITEDGILRPEMTDWFSTYEADYIPLQVKNISVLALEVDENNGRSLLAEVAFEPAKAPAGVEGLQAEHRHLYDQFYDLNVVWDEPHLEPDNYTIEVTEANDTLLVTDNVPGNQTEIFFPNVKLGSHYIVNIIAESLGGVSVLTTIEKDIVNEYARVNKSYRELIIGVTMSITIAILVGMIYLQYYKQKNKHFSVECARFESFGQKDQPIETTTKLLHKDYESEFNNIPLVHDKFELSPKLLKLNNILGSGAYGIVRLGSLEDKFGNTTNVAVKMLKENPSMEDVQNFHKEILIMKFAGQHPNIVSLIGCCLLYKKPVLVVEYCCKGDLQTYLRKPKKLTDRLQECLSSNRIIHRDLAARNILVCADGIVKISDFGLSRDVYQENLYRKQGNGKLPLKWIAIEALTHQVYTTQSDVYDVMFCCWNTRPQNRPTFTQLKESLDKLLFHQSENKYLNMDEILYDDQDQYRILKK
ncbi:Fibroblast growth factor receptor 3 [Dufourea novaeangliae]|uniref:receptor protein-tyrosine kinase n=1 Tax=Dufourea novaeangliae TaxID=178035 RepID=A0A154P631_DUFNO|nr:Fibroblast growth factor receptor 3 [Dufourea novaeangliae]